MVGSVGETKPCEECALYWRQGVSVCQCTEPTHCSLLQALVVDHLSIAAPSPASLILKPAIVTARKTEQDF